MTSDIITQLIDGSYRDPESFLPVCVETRALAIEPSLAGLELDLVRPLALGKRLAVVSDRTTHAVLGERVERALKGAFRIDSVVLPARPHADEKTVETIRRETAAADALIAVGSGTVNDLCKFASAGSAKPYVVFGTAPSMNGYTSLNAAITVHGHKKSLAAQAPAGAFFDLAILSAAPPRMIRSGLGDSLCRPTAQADWLLAHLLLDQPFRKLPFALLAADEGPLFESAGALLAGDAEAMQLLVRTLVLSGFGTAICGSSQPASQGEHLISHYADMMGDPSWPAAFHGEQIGVTTLTMAHLQERLLDGPPPELAADEENEVGFARRFGPALGRSCWSEFAQKRSDAATARALNERLAARWSQMQEAIGAVLRPMTYLRSVLERAGAPTRPGDIGWPAAFYGEAVRNARLIRSRYTFLDLAACSGRLDIALAPT
jgi:glycerol-1-phosphate dehydrogenase [NAD(P)+]